MKKIGILFVMVILLLTGCGKKDSKDIINDYKKKINKSKSYELIGNMEIMNNDDIFKYDINVKYLNDEIEYYKVDLTNQANNHQQVILKNNDGVYVITPSLNKSFKFQSDWPNNGSQSYILSSLAYDMENDTKVKIDKKDGKYVITNKVNYPNNDELVCEKIYLKNDMLPEKVEVYDNSNNIKIKVNFSKIDLKANIDEDEFEVSKLIKEECKDCDDKKEEKSKKESNEQTTSIDDIIYPLYVPENTSLKSKDVVNTEEGERVILTFSGDNSFVLVEEKSTSKNEFEVIPVYGEPQIINDSVAALSSNSISWTSNNIDYYLTGATLSKSDLIKVASSMSNVGTVSLEK